MIRKLTGGMPRFVGPDDPRINYLVGGSIVGFAGPRSIVWGSGIMHRSDRVCPEATFLAVRGPLTRDQARECGASCPDILGDPALLLPRLYRPTRVARRGIGVVLHFADAPWLRGRIGLDDGMRLIDVQSPVESFIDAISGCELVVSSSLHGLVVSHAYGIPATWARFKDLPSGDDSKFVDYFASIGRRAARPIRPDPARLEVDAVEAAAVPADIDLDLEALWASCPFRGVDS